MTERLEKWRLIENMSKDWQPHTMKIMSPEERMTLRRASTNEQRKIQRQVAEVMRAEQHRRAEERDYDGPDVPNYSSQKGAQKNAKVVRDYWAKRGIKIKTRVVPLDPRTPKMYGDGRQFYCVRSNIAEVLGTQW